MIEYIDGANFEDQRGSIRFVNLFDLKNVRRFYIINNLDTSVLRGWSAHKVESRWFYVIRGSFMIDIVKIDDWEVPSQNLQVTKTVLSYEENKVLHLTSGYGTMIQAINPNSELLVFSDFGIENANDDNYKYPVDYFTNWQS